MKKLKAKTGTHNVTYDICVRETVKNMFSKISSSLNYVL